MADSRQPFQGGVGGLNIGSYDLQREARERERQADYLQYVEQQRERQVGFEL